MNRLIAKLRRRIRARDRQIRRWQRTRKRGHGLAAIRHARAVRYLRHLIRRARTITPDTDTSAAGVRFISDFEGFFATPNDQGDSTADGLISASMRKNFMVPRPVRGNLTRIHS